MAHRLNLVLVDACKVTRHAAVFFLVLESLYCFFSRPGNHKKFCNVQESLNLKSRLELTQLSDTRWACRWRNVNTTKRLFASIISCLEELSDSVEAQGLLIHMKKIDFAVSFVAVSTVNMTNVD